MRRHYEESEKANHMVREDICNTCSWQRSHSQNIESMATNQKEKDIDNPIEQ